MFSLANKFLTTLELQFFQHRCVGFRWCLWYRPSLSRPILLCMLWSAVRWAVFMWRRWSMLAVHCGSTCTAVTLHTRRQWPRRFSQCSETFTESTEWRCRYSKLLTSLCQSAASANCPSLTGCLRQLCDACDLGAPAELTDDSDVGEVTGFNSCYGLYESLFSSRRASSQSCCSALKNVLHLSPHSENFIALKSTVYDLLHEH